jgi:hypothetical protein
MIISPRLYRSEWTLSEANIGAKKMKTIKLTRENLKPRPDMGEDWYEWEGCDTEADIIVDAGIDLFVTGNIYTHGGDINTFGGAIHTGGAHIITEGGRIETDDGDIYTEGGFILTSGGGIETYNGDIETDGGIIG